MFLLSILSRRPENWQIDRALAESLRSDLALIQAKPAQVVTIRGESNARFYSVARPAGKPPGKS
jgi:hypothetical protein